MTLSSVYRTFIFPELWNFSTLSFVRNPSPDHSSINSSDLELQVFLVKRVLLTAQSSLKSVSSSCTTSLPSEELKQLREELAEVYKQKSRNDQSLIEANKRLDKHDAVLSTITKE